MSRTNHRCLVQVTLSHGARRPLGVCLSAGGRAPWRRRHPRPAASSAEPGVLSPESLLPVLWLRIPKALWRIGNCVQMSQTPVPRNPDGTASGSCLPKSKKKCFGCVGRVARGTPAACASPLCGPTEAAGSLCPSIQPG